MSSANISSQQSPELEPELEQQQKKDNQKSKVPRWWLAILLIGGGVSLWQVFTIR